MHCKLAQLQQSKHCLVVVGSQMLKLPLSVVGSQMLKLPLSVNKEVQLFGCGRDL
jgi:hypothetical protein